MHSKEISAVREYIDNSFFSPARNWPEHYFNERVYSRWAANEILLQIENSIELPPCKVVEKFIVKMDYFLWLKEDTNHEFIFSIARDTGYDILDMLIANIEKER